MELDNNYEKIKRIIFSSSLYGIKTVDARTAVMLYKNDLFKTLKEKHLPDEALSVLSNPNHEKRIKTVSQGPLVAYNIDSSHNEIIGVVDNLLSQNPKERLMAYMHFELLLSTDEYFLKETENILKENKADLLSSDKSKWTVASIKITDSINNDFLCNLAGVRQSLEMRFNQGLQDYLPRVIIPKQIYNIHANIRFTNIQKQNDDIAFFIKDISENAKSVDELCERYYQALGIFPLNGKFSLGQTVLEWTNIHGVPSTLWFDVWKWAENNQSTIKLYQACCIFIKNPDFIPLDRIDYLFQVIKLFVGIANDKGDNIQVQCHLIRIELAKHYQYLLESISPEKDGENLTCAAWWLSERLSNVLSIYPKMLEQFRKKSISPDTNRSYQLWHMTRTHISSSAYRTATIAFQSPWTTALFSEIWNNINAFCRKEMLYKNISELYNIMIASYLGCASFQYKQSDIQYYPFEKINIPDDSTLEILFPDQKCANTINSIKNIYVDVICQNKLSTSLNILSKYSENDQKIIANALQTIALNGQISYDDIWDIISKEEWYKNTLINMNVIPMEMVLDILIDIQVQDGIERRSHIPHIIALACEASQNNEEKNTILFAYVIIASLRTDTFSAIQRLLADHNRFRYKDKIEFWRKELKRIQSYAPHWIKARIRPILAVLQI